MGKKKDRCHVSKAFSDEAAYGSLDRVTGAFHLIMLRKAPAGRKPIYILNIASPALPQSHSFSYYIPNRS